MQMLITAIKCYLLSRPFFLLEILLPPGDHHHAQQHPADAESEVPRQVHRVEDRNAFPAYIINSISIWLTAEGLRLCVLLPPTRAGLGPKNGPAIFGHCGPP